MALFNFFGIWTWLGRTLRWSQRWVLLNRIWLHRFYSITVATRLVHISEMYCSCARLVFWVARFWLIMVCLFDCWVCWRRFVVLLETRILFFGLVDDVLRWVEVLLSMDEEELGCHGHLEQKLAWGEFCYGRWGEVRWGVGAMIKGMAFLAVTHTVPPDV